MIWKYWHAACRPRTGPLYNQTKRNIKSYLQHCRVNDERKQRRVQDHMIRTKYPSLPQKKITCSTYDVFSTALSVSNSAYLAPNNCLRDNFQEALKQLLGARYAEFETLSAVEKTYVLGSEYWEDDFDALLHLVKEFIVAIWEVRKQKLYGDDSHPGQRAQFRSLIR